ncbi:dTDP-4-dehydrorhamnose 3,5-epimerase [uncultured Psychrobacter sp.]|uniref:dTDP-4-dehydrorhamnose 3,5-epimerase n=1 Tax=uncultured Psychrobacter sp. TaxID=259303 RepID=UPI0026192E74|nr:dTDP-4-dehydrorhamnose 3,5-epimerase [uncultured Psychrobacter sp.]
MQLRRTAIADVIIIEPKVHGDERGYFFESYREDVLERFVGHSVNFIQDNESKSDRGVLRGLHYQIGNSAQSKLVRVISGRVLDVAVDIRKGSPTFAQHVAIELSADNKRQVLIPRGFAHGFAVLEDNTIFSYKVDNYYSPAEDRGIAFDDPRLAINWGLPTSELLLSAKDQQQPLLADAELFSYQTNYYRTSDYEY